MTGTEWLARCSPSPEAARQQWSAGELAPIRTTVWSVVEMNDLLRAVDALLVLRRTGRPGPVPACPESKRVWWLLPPGRAAAFDGCPGLTARPANRALPCPPADEPLCGRGWLEKPDGSGRLTDPARLATALGLPAATAVPIPAQL
ncbi:hypothetical protein I5Q34_25550 [Streptomyces sp. AV19]|uniref:hypothetical protein n=1 Tax=Streptomyces sp. AV19 TaxID=2793068 RepID=UPI0018FE88EC|nr:hypothetical protein [Streptomyces sp. AV19]MBH1937596.1 hypothetical protein [Streptomyces sp. AV19]MDG4536471.1 hypothetical protein [Streptomyces sp. AV19]